MLLLIARLFMTSKLRIFVLLWILQIKVILL